LQGFLIVQSTFVVVTFTVFIFHHHTTFNLVIQINMKSTRVKLIRSDEEQFEVVKSIIDLMVSHIVVNEDRIVLFVLNLV